MQMDIAALPRSAELIDRAGDTLVLRVVDQRSLPQNLVFVDITTYHDAIEAIKNMTVRGAPLIGYCGACALTLWACNEFKSQADMTNFIQQLAQVKEAIATARPTAVNLAKETNALFKIVQVTLKTTDDLDEIKRTMIDHCATLAKADEATNREIGSFGAELLSQNSTVLTHCNAGSLATVFYGTALGVIYSAASLNKIDRVYIDETRPLGQGSRLTAWELSQAGIPGTLICDNMAASIMATGQINAVIVGADRVCANGDFANKIGTYGLAVLAKHHSIPFYVAAPRSSFDFDLQTGSEIPIETRDGAEISTCDLSGIELLNPAFDVTPANLVTSYVTEVGVIEANNLDVLRESN